VKVALEKRRRRVVVDIGEWIESGEKGDEKQKTKKSRVGMLVNGHSSTRQKLDQFN